MSQRTLPVDLPQHVVRHCLGFVALEDVASFFGASKSCSAAVEGFLNLLTRINLAQQASTPSLMELGLSLAIKHCKQLQTFAKAQFSTDESCSTLVLRLIA